MEQESATSPNSNPSLPAHGRPALGLLFLGILLGLLIGIGGYWGWQKYAQSNTPSTVSTTTTTTVPVPSSASTASATTSPVVSNTSTPTTTETVVSNEFDVTKLKVGDKVGAMTVTSIEKAVTSDSAGTLSALPLAQNFAVKFSGDVDVAGTYEYFEPGLTQAQICFHSFDAVSAKKLPTPKASSSISGLTEFCFTNQDSAKTSLTNTVGAKGTATISIDSLTISRVPADGPGDEAHLVKAVTK